MRVCVCVRVRVCVCVQGGEVSGEGRNVTHLPRVTTSGIHCIRKGRTTGEGVEEGWRRREEEGGGGRRDEGEKG